MRLPEEVAQGAIRIFSEDYRQWWEAVVSDQDRPEYWRDYARYMLGDLSEEEFLYKHQPAY